MPVPYRNFLRKKSASSFINRNSLLTSRQQIPRKQGERRCGSVSAGLVAAAVLALVAGAGCAQQKSTAAPKAAGKLVIWADDKRTAALKPFAEKFGTENGVTVEVQAVSKDLQTNFVTASQSGNGAGHRGRRARLDRQPGAERRHRPGAALGGAEERLRGAGDQGRHLQRPGVRRALRHREPGPDPQHRARTRRTGLHRGRRGHRPEAQGRGQGQRDPVVAGRAERRRLPRVPAVHVRRRLPVRHQGQRRLRRRRPGPGQAGGEGRVREDSRRWGRRATVRSSGPSARRTRSPRSPVARPRSWCPARGRSPTSRRPTSSTRSRPSPASPAARRPSRSSACRRSTSPARGRTRRSRRSSSPTT